MKTRIWVIVAVVLLLIPAMAQAEWERSVSAWDTRLPDEGKVQVSFWGGYWENEVRGVDIQENTGYIDITYGLSDRWSFCVSPSVYRWNLEPGPAESGLSDTSVMTTYRFLDEDTHTFDMAVMASLSLPTGDDDKGLGSGKVEPGATLLLSKTLGPFIAVANLGGRAILDSRSNVGEKDFTGWAVLEGVYPLTERLSLNLAFSASTKRYDNADDGADVGLGFRFTPVKWMFLAGMAYASFTDAYDWGVDLAFGFEF